MYFKMFESFMPRREKEKVDYIFKMTSYFTDNIELNRELSFLKKEEYELYGTMSPTLLHGLQHKYLTFLLERRVKFSEEEMQVISASKFNFNKEYDRIYIHDEGQFFKHKLKSNDVRYVLFDTLSDQLLIFKKNTDLKTLLEAIKLTAF